MTTLTQNQAAAMTALIKSCLDNMGGSSLECLQDDPLTWVDAQDLIDAGWSQKEAEGTFGSLVSAGLIHEHDLKEFALNEDWDELAKYHA